MILPFSKVKIIIYLTSSNYTGTFYLIVFYINIVKSDFLAFVYILHSDLQAQLSDQLILPKSKQ